MAVGKKKDMWQKCSVSYERYIIINIFQNTSDLLTGKNSY